MTIELLTLIALWCGNPSSQTIYGEGSQVTVQQVNECREKLLACLENPTEISYIGEAATKCVKQMPHPGKDN